MFDILDISIQGGEFWDSATETFINLKPITLHLKHSLISLTRWEQYYKRKYLSDGPKTIEENLYYICCMVLNKDVPNLDLYVRQINQNDYERIQRYVQDDMTATTLPPQPKSDKKPEPLSSELIYYYMTGLNIPFSCEKWHLSNLLMLINIANIKNQPEDKKKKRSSAAIMHDYSALNRARRAKLHTKG